MGDGINNEYIFTLICDLACEVRNEKSIASHTRTKGTEKLSVEEIIVLLKRETKNDFGDNLKQWADWAIDKLDLELGNEERTMMQAIRAIGTLDKIEKKIVNKKQRRGKNHND